MGYIAILVRETELAIWRYSEPALVPVIVLTHANSEASGISQRWSNGDQASGRKRLRSGYQRGVMAVSVMGKAWWAQTAYDGLVIRVKGGKPSSYDVISFRTDTCQQKLLSYQLIENHFQLTGQQYISAIKTTPRSSTHWSGMHYVALLLPCLRHRVASSMYWYVPSTATSRTNQMFSVKLPRSYLSVIRNRFYSPQPKSWGYRPF